MQNLKCGGSGMALILKYVALHSQQKLSCTYSTHGRQVRMHLCRTRCRRFQKFNTSLKLQIMFKKY